MADSALAHDTELGEERRPPARSHKSGRIEGTSEYLSKGRAQVYGEPYTRVVHESKTGAEHNWDILRDAIEEASKAGIATKILSDYQVLFANRFDSDAKPDGDIYERFREQRLGKQRSRE